jgi:hypothetical protein
MKTKKVERGLIYFGGAEGKIVHVKPADGKKFTLEEWQAAVGGPVQQMVPARRGAVVWVNEEGKLLGLPPNRHTWGVAKREVYARNGYPPGWRIAGNALVIAKYAEAQLDDALKEAVTVAQALREA